MTLMTVIWNFLRLEESFRMFWGLQMITELGCEAAATSPERSCCAQHVKEGLHFLYCLNGAPIPHHHRNPHHLHLSFISSLVALAFCM